MLHRGKRIIEMVEQLTPLPISVGLTETNFVILHRVPPREQEIAAPALKAPVHFYAVETLGRGDEGLGGLKRPLEVRLLARPHVENRNLENHPQISA